MDLKSNFALKNNSMEFLLGPITRRKNELYESAQNPLAVLAIRSSDNDSTGFWPPGSLHTLGADGHI